AVVWRGRVGACQFHPEKSSDAGEEMLKRWLTWLRNGAEPCP
ncbi:MAG: imidazole glycerol phosphate synthase subunit HisH, partial [Synechococcus sp.]